MVSFASTEAAWTNKHTRILTVCMKAPSDGSVDSGLEFCIIGRESLRDETRHAEDIDIDLTGVRQTILIHFA